MPSYYFFIVVTTCHSVFLSFVSLFLTWSYILVHSCAPDLDRARATEYKRGEGTQPARLLHAPAPVEPRLLPESPRLVGGAARWRRPPVSGRRNRRVSGVTPQPAVNHRARNPGIGHFHHPRHHGGRAGRLLPRQLGEFGVWCLCWSRAWGGGGGGRR